MNQQIRSGHVLILGGGASGVLMAAHLLHGGPCRVTLVDPAPQPGRGVAYATDRPQHLLNTRIRSMSAWDDDPGHFRRWLEGQPDVPDGEFMPRGIYGRYLTSLLDPWRGDTARLRIVRATAVRLDEHPRGVVAALEDGQLVIADQAVLATGHVRPAPDPAGLVAGAWDDLPPPAPDARVVIVGTGLSMVDQVLTLLAQGHRGEIVALSRRGLLPRPHAEPGPGITLSVADLPLGAPASALMRWVRDLAGRVQAGGGTWQDAVDAIRPQIRRLWRALPPAERARFLRHAASWWEVHRHRLPPASGLAIDAAVASGRLRVIRAGFIGAELDDGGLVAVVQPPGGPRQALAAGRIIDCRGIRRDPAAHASALMAGLLERGAARIDPLGIGPEVTGACQLIGRNGTPSQRLHAIGPVSRAAFWEITAVPDIRAQVAELAGRLAAICASR
ncbi:FAD/NAD(P)-binding protein [Gemmobacter sp.]|uniref:FAD/NAD(P)-binding protein n=1 Tax=Gemmobacter sp. TaxID=1898957 RepID=UPI002AFE053E|nr:FAD/NAD(P)-binding protein [Gemmobacter sp.]